MTMRTLRSVDDWYGGQNPLDALEFQRATKKGRVGTNNEILKRGSAIEAEAGRFQMNERVLVRSGLNVVQARQAPQDLYGSDANVVRFCVVSGEDARDNKGLDVQGGNTQAFRANPVVPWCHIYNEPPVGRGRYIATMKRAGGPYELWSDVEFIPEDIYPFGAVIGRMYKGGWLRGISLGWIPTKVREVRSRGGKLQKVVSEQWEMVEESACAIPIDRWGLAEMASAGIFGEGTKRSHLADNFVETYRRTVGDNGDWTGWSEGVAYEISGKDVRMVPDCSEGAATEDGLSDEARAVLTEARESITRAYEPEAQRELVEEHHIDPESNLGDLKALSVEAAAVRSLGAGEDDPVEEPEARSEPTGEDPEGEALEVEQASGERLPGELLRGEVSDELDLVYDRLRGAVVAAMDATERLYWLGNSAYWQGRSLAETLGFPPEQRERVLAETRQLGADDPESPDALHNLIARQTKRLRSSANLILEATVAAEDAMDVGDSVGETASAEVGASVVEEAGLTEALSIMVHRMADEGVEIRAGKKISKSRREKIGGLLKQLQSVTKGLKQVLGEGEREAKVEDEPKAETASLGPKLAELRSLAGLGDREGVVAADPVEAPATRSRVLEILDKAKAKAKPLDGTDPKPESRTNGELPGVRVPKTEGKKVTAEFARDLAAGIDKLRAKAGLDQGAGAE